jgi:hypothetical protein
MTFIEQGSTGAFRATWRKDNPRSLLETMIAKNPKAEEEKIHELFWHEIEDDKPLLRACVEYWLDNNYRSLIAEKRKPTTIASSTTKTASTVTARATKEVSQKIEQRIVSEARTMLLDLRMPNDKKLGDCTGAECRSFGGWMALIGKKVPATKLVSKVLSNDDAWQLWELAKKKTAA